jgi:cell filamentation protein
MKDPYLYPNTGTLINLFDERDEQRLDKIEANYTGLRLRQVIEHPVEGLFDVTHLCNIHRFIFQDIFDWAGQPRVINIEKPELALGGLSVEYSDVHDLQKHIEVACARMNDELWATMTIEQKAENFSKYMSELWKIHPFREGNTRTTVSFCSHSV